MEVLVILLHAGHELAARRLAVALRNVGRVGSLNHFFFDLLLALSHQGVDVITFVDGRTEAFFRREGLVLDRIGDVGRVINRLDHLAAFVLNA